MRIKIFVASIIGLLLTAACTSNLNTPPATQEPLPSAESTIEIKTETPEIETISDVDGNSYPIIHIGEQWWMGANLNTTSDPNGNPIQGYCYNNDEANCEIYGRLYGWNSAMNGSSRESARGICPAGWHIPSDAEWQQLINFLGNESDAGGKLKQAGTDLWLSPNTGATNQSGFNALPTGWFDFTGEFFGLGDGCLYRTSSAESSWEVYARILSSERASFTRGGVHPDDALPIRCVRD
jgi:uncharacterized protein (TIGR02145 family)